MASGVDKAGVAAASAAAARSATVVLVNSLRRSSTERWQVCRNAATGPAKRKGWADDGGQTDRIERIHRVLEAGDAVIFAVFAFR